MHSDSRQRRTMFEAFVGVLSLFVGGVASQTLDFRNLRSCEQGHIQWNVESLKPPMIPLESYTFSLSATGSGGITYTLNITNVGSEGFDFTPNWVSGTPVSILQSPPPPRGPPFTNVVVQEGSGNDSCTIGTAIDAASASSSSPDPTQALPLGFVPQNDSQIQCNISSVVWTGNSPPYDVRVLNANPTGGVSASIELNNLRSNGMTLKVPFPAGKYAWVITDANGATSNAIFPIDPSADDSCLIMPSTSNPSESSTSTTISEPTTSSTTEPTPIATATPQSAEAPKGPSKKSIIIAAVLGPVLGLLAVFGIGFFVYYRIRRRNREKELKMKQEVTYVPPQHARLIDVKVKPPDIE